MDSMATWPLCTQGQNHSHTNLFTPHTERFLGCKNGPRNTCPSWSALGRWCDYLLSQTRKLRPRKMAHSNLVNRDEQDSLGILSPSQGTWGGPGCLLHLDWLTFFLFINLSFSLWKQLEFVFPGSPEKRVSVKILEEVAEGPDLSWTAWHSISRFTPRCLPLFFWKWFWLQMDLLRLKEVHSSL